MTASALEGGAEAAGFGATSTVRGPDGLRRRPAAAQRWCRRRCTPTPPTCSFRSDRRAAGVRVQRPNDWGLGFEIRDGKSPHWTGSSNSGRTYGHFGQSGTFLWVDPDADLALVVLTDRDFGEWAYHVAGAV